MVLLQPIFLSVVFGNRRRVPVARETVSKKKEGEKGYISHSCI